MLSNEAQVASTVKLLDPVSAANTAAATSGWTDVRNAEGDISHFVYYEFGRRMGVARKVAAAPAPARDPA